MNIEWRVVPSFDCYEVSEYGDVRRCKAGIRGGRVGKLMKPYVRDDGYRMYILRKDNRSYHKKAHQLVAEAFIGLKPFPKAEVCHRDGTRYNDHYSNLRWDTSAGNKADMVGHGTRLVGERVRASKLSREQVMQMLEMRSEGITQREIAEKLGVYQSCISKIDRGVRWAHLTGKKPAMIKRGTRPRSMQDASPRPPRLTEDQVKYIPVLRERGLKQRHIADIFGVSQTYISKIERCLCKKHLPANSNKRPDLAA